MYRTDVSREILRALEDLPPGTIRGASVEKLRRTGSLLYNGVDAVSSDASIVAASIHLRERAKIGNIVRIGGEVAMVHNVQENVVVVNAAFQTQVGLSAAYVMNGARYRIEFESGCTADADCTHNGRVGKVLGERCRCYVHRWRGLPMFCRGNVQWRLSRPNARSWLHAIRKRDKFEALQGGESGEAAAARVRSAQDARGAANPLSRSVVRSMPSKIRLSGMLSGNELRAGDRIFHEGQNSSHPASGG